MKESARVAVKAAIVFHTWRDHMVKAEIQLSENPSQRLFIDIKESPIASKIERLLKGPKFSLAYPGSPSEASSSFKKQRLNLNSSLANKSFVSGWGRCNPSRRGGNPARGSHDFRGGSRGRASFRNPNHGFGYHAGFGNMDANMAHTEGTNPGTSLGISNMAHSSSPMASRTLIPLKDRVLMWEEDS